MPRTSLVITGVLFISCALVLSGCGSNETARDESSSLAATASAAEAESGDEEGSPAGLPVETVTDSQAVAASPEADAPAGVTENETDIPDSEETGAMSDTDASTTSELPPQDDEDTYEMSPSDDAYTQRTSPAGVSVTRAYICRGIEESEPTDAGRSFLPKEDGLNRLCCFSEIIGSAGPDSIWHVWYWGGREMGRVGLEVKSARWRTWSRKQVLDEWKGEWHVDIVDASDFLLYRLDFSIE